MIVIPAVDIMDHRVVQLVGGIPGSEKITLPDPLRTAMDWVDKGAEYLHIVDLDGAFGKENNIPVIKDIIKRSGVPVEIGGGIRDEKTIKDLLDAGADRVIVGTKAVKDTVWLTNISNRFPDRIVLALDTKDGNILIKGWQESSPISLDDMFSIIRNIPLAAVLNTDVNVEGQGKGINRTQAKQFIKNCPCPVIASGGISSENDARFLSEAGAKGAVVGISIYTGMMRPWEWSVPWNM